MYLHEFTFRWEQISTPIHGWTSASGDSEGSVPDSGSLRRAKEEVRRMKAGQLNCHPGQIVVFLVNHTAFAS